MDQTIRYRLVLAKRFFENAKANLDRGDLHSIAVAVVSAHDAVDNLLGAVATHLGVHLKDETTLLRTYDAIGGGGHSLGSRARLAQLNALRVDVKHHGLHPNPTIVGQLIAEMLAFADLTCSTHFGQTLGEVRLVDAIQDESVRLSMNSVEDVIEQGDYRGAIERIAFVIFEVFERSQLSQQRFFRSIAAHMSGKTPVHPDFDFPEFDRGELRLALLELGITAEEYQRFHVLVPEVGLRSGSDTAFIMRKVRQVWHEENWTRANAEIAFDFVMRLILAKQDHPAKDPFVRKHPLDKLTFIRDSSVKVGLGKDAVVTEFRAGDEVLTSTLPYVDGAWQNFGEDNVQTWIYIGDESKFAEISKVDVTVTPDVDVSKFPLGFRT